MSIELLQLVGLIAFIFFIFRYFVLKPSSKAPAPAPAPTSPPPILKEEQKQMSPLSSKYMPPDQTIHQLEKQSSEESSFILPQAHQHSQKAAQLPSQAKEESQNSLDPNKLEKSLAKSMPERNQPEQEQNFNQHKEGSFLLEQSFSQPQPKQKQESTSVNQITPSATNSLIKLYEVSSSEFKESESRHNFEVKDVVSECEEMSMIEEAHSSAYRIEVSELQSKRRHKLKVVKEHYKSIIQNLKQKLEEVCIRHNESLESDLNNRTVTFSEEESSFFGEDQRAELEVKAEEVAILRDELQLHEDILTNMIEEDNKLKDQLRTLEEQNSTLKIALQSSTILQQEASHYPLSLSRNRSDNILSKSEDGANSFSEMKFNSEGIEGVESRIMELYASQILGSIPIKNSLLSSQVLSKQSTILMMSLVEGAISIGMLGECRFLNQISKKFAIGEVKKFRKQKVVNAELIYSFEEETGDYNASLYAVLSAYINLLILVKLENQSVAIFTERVFSEENGQRKEEIENKFLLLNLTKRKAYIREGICFYTNNQIIFGDEKYGWLSEFPPYIFQGGEWCGDLQFDENVPNVAVFQLTLQPQGE